MIHIFIATQADARLEQAFVHLLPQLSVSLPQPSAAELERLVNSETTAVFCAECDGMIVGMASLAWYDVPSGRHAWIEDVVADAAWRRHGIGQALVCAAVEHAVQIGADKVSLTSHASRTAAHALYRQEGFEVYDTTLFRRRLR